MRRGRGGQRKREREREKTHRGNAHAPCPGAPVWVWCSVCNTSKCSCEGYNKRFYFFTSLSNEVMQYIGRGEAKLEIVQGRRVALARMKNAVVKLP